MSERPSPTQQLLPGHVHVHQVPRGDEVVGEDVEEGVVLLVAAQPLSVGDITQNLATNVQLCDEANMKLIDVLVLKRLLVTNKGTCAHCWDMTYTRL